MKNKLSKKEVQEEISSFFRDIKSKSPKEIKKIKKLAMSKNITLKDKRKLFCKKCLYPYDKPKIRINNKKKVVECNKCGYVTRWKL